jgi:hypothetical protein
MIHIDNTKKKKIMRTVDYGIGPVTFHDGNTREYTKDPMTLKDLGDNGYLVVGTNVDGAHSGGAARFAHDNLGLVWGVGEGESGRAYALPTLNFGKTQFEKDPKKYFGVDFKLSESELLAAMLRFQHHARLNPEKKWYLTKIGLGIAGFDLWTIHKLFWSTELMLLDNIVYPPDFEAPDDMFG